MVKTGLLIVLICLLCACASPATPTPTVSATAAPVPSTTPMPTPTHTPAPTLPPAKYMIQDGIAMVWDNSGYKPVKNVGNGVVKASDVKESGEWVVFEAENGAPVAISLEDGGLIPVEFTKSGKQFVGVMGNKLMSWDGTTLADIASPFAVVDGKVMTVEKGMLVEAGIAADRIETIRSGMVFYLENEITAFMEPDETKHDLIAGMEMREDGSIWGINLQTGQFESQQLPGGVDPVKAIEKYSGPVEKDQGKILGLNEFGWTVAEYKDGQWVPFEREIKIAGNQTAIDATGVKVSDISSEILTPLRASELVPAVMKQLYDRWGRVLDNYHGWGLLPTEADGRLKTGFLATSEIMRGNLYSGYILGAMSATWGGIEGQWLIIEVPFTTQRQIVLQFIPSQTTYTNDVYMYRQVDKDGEPGAESLQIQREPKLYQDYIKWIKERPRLRGNQVLFGQGFFTYDEDYIRRRDALFEALERGEAIDSSVAWTIVYLWLPKALD